MKVKIKLCYLLDKFLNPSSNRKLRMFPCLCQVGHKSSCHPPPVKLCPTSRRTPCCRCRRSHTSRCPSCFRPPPPPLHRQSLPSISCCPSRVCKSLIKHHLTQLAHEHHSAAYQGPFPISCVQKGWVEGLVCGADLRHGGRGLRPVAALRVFPLPRSRACPCLHQRVLPLVDVFVFEILLVVSSLWSHNWFCPWTRPCIHNV